MESYHCDVESIKKVKGESCDQINKEPCGAVMEVDGLSVVDYLTRLAHVGGTKIKDNI